MNNVLVGLNIKKARKAKKMTQKELATKIGRVESSIRKYEKGDVEIPTSILEQIAKILDTSLLSLIGQSNNAMANSTNHNIFLDLLLQMGYTIYFDDPEHKLFFKKPDGNIYIINREDLDKIYDTAEAYIRYNIDRTLEFKKKL